MTNPPITEPAGIDLEDLIFNAGLVAAGALNRLPVEQQRAANEAIGKGGEFEVRVRLAEDGQIVEVDLLGDAGTRTPITRIELTPDTH